MRKFLGLLAIFALAALSAAGVAAGSSNLANGTTLTFTNAGPIAFSGVITCNSSTIKATLTNNGAGAGASADVTSASFTNCGAGNAMSVTNLPARFTFNGSFNPWNWRFDRFRVDPSLGSVPCTYEGDPSGGNYNNNTEQLTLAGNLTYVSGSGICLFNQNPSLSGTYTVSPTLQLS